MSTLVGETRRRLRESENEYDGYIRYGSHFANKVVRTLKRSDEVQAGDICFCYDTACLEIFEELRKRDVFCVIDQVDPHRLFQDIVEEERKLWPGWMAADNCAPEAYFRRREQEWKFAHKIVVNSEFSRSAVLRERIPVNKVSVLPLSFEAPPVNAELEKRVMNLEQGHRLRGLFLGRVTLSKGIQYLIRAAKLLEEEPIDIDVVGPIEISMEVVASAPKNLRFHGRVSRGETRTWYKASDFLVFPTLADGFGLTQLEAMAYGLPVIATPNCGAVVRHEVDGQIVPIRSADALAMSMHRFISDREFLKSCSCNALERVKDFSLERLTSNLKILERELYGNFNETVDVTRR